MPKVAASGLPCPHFVKSVLPRPSIVAVLRVVAVAAVVLAATAVRLAHAQEEPAWAPDAALVKEVETMARSGAGTAAGSQADERGVRVEVQVGRLDPRLKLAPCAHIEPYLPPGAPVWGATRMGLRCTQGAKRWNVSLPLTVHVYMRATVVNANLGAGTVLQAGQLGEAEVDLGAAPGVALRDPRLAVGRTLARNLNAGAPVRVSDLKARQYFAAGETVRVVALGAGWQVVTEGQAMNAGVEGQTARVRTESGRILNARPSGDREVELTL
jgi:flagella basal body P-ring formation protein FlgA